MTHEERAIELAKQDKEHDCVRGWVELHDKFGLPYSDSQADEIMLAYNTERLRDRKMIGETK